MGLDAEFWFAIADVSSLCDDPDFALPNHTSKIEIDVGNGFDHREPVGGEPSAPDPDHLYRYAAVGSGHAVAVRHRDGGNSDDHWILKVRVFEVD